MTFSSICILPWYLPWFPQATDADTGMNAMIKYHISANDADVPFEVHADSGSLFTAREFTGSDPTKFSFDVYGDNSMDESQTTDKSRDVIVVVSDNLKYWYNIYFIIYVYMKFIKRASF